MADDDEADVDGTHDGEAPVEIERKFLVEGDGWRSTVRSSRHMVQGYLSTDPARSVRVRLEDDTGATLTIKGPGDGPVRDEFEYEIPSDHGRAILELCRRPLIEKTRHLVDHGGLT